MTEDSSEFYDAIARYYDLEHDQFEDDIELYLNYSRACGSPVLELACGTGRIVLALAKAGFHVVGVDASPGMLDVARRKAQQAGISGLVSFVEADLAGPQLPAGRERFPLALLALDSFAHLASLPRQDGALMAVGQNMTDGGILIADLANPFDALLTERQGELALHRVLVDPVTGSTVTKMVARDVDPAEQMENVTLVYDEVDADGRVKRTVGGVQLRHVFRYEMQLLMEKCGFQTEAVYGSYDLDAYSAESERMIFVARKIEDRR